MKSIRCSSRVFFIIVIFTFFISCRKEKKEDRLPAETQIGAGTLRFKIDNTSYKLTYPGAAVNYLHLNDPFSTGYHVTIHAESRTSSAGSQRVLSIVTDILRLDEGGSHPVNNKVFEKGKAFAFFTDSKEYFCKSDLQGEVHITRLDSVNSCMPAPFDLMRSTLQERLFG